MRTTATPAPAYTAPIPRYAPEQLRGMGKDEARELSDALFRRLASIDPETPAHGYVRGTIIELNLPLVRFVAARFRHRSEPMEDIVQAGIIGLIKAVDAFDVERGVEFATYAIPTISGEIKRFFRDTSWPVSVPRGGQELYLAVVRASDALEQELGRPPTAQQIALHMQLDVHDVHEGRYVARMARTDSLDSTAGGDDPSDNTLMDRVGAQEAGYDLVDFRVSVQPLLAELPERERTIVLLRFWGNLTQSQIGERIGISQMHVSRLLAASLAWLRERLPA